MGFHEFKRQLIYKTAHRGGLLIVANRWYASSKLCSNCGYKLASLDLGTRQWTCPACHVHHDRDVNAAINLRGLAVSSTIIACGGKAAGIALRLHAQVASQARRMRRETPATLLRANAR
jgi:putative transposase